MVKAKEKYSNIKNELNYNAIKKDFKKQFNNIKIKVDNIFNDAYTRIEEYLSFFKIGLSKIIEGYQDNIFFADENSTDSKSKLNINDIIKQDMDDNTSQKGIFENIKSLFHFADAEEQIKKCENFYENHDYLFIQYEKNIKEKFDELKNKKIDLLK